MCSENRGKEQGNLLKWQMLSGGQSENLELLGAASTRGTDWAFSQALSRAIIRTIGEGAEGGRMLSTGGGPSRREGKG